MTTLYGIKNCDTVRKARKWLEANGIDYTFHDFRLDGLDAARLKQWSKLAGWENLLNRRSTSWRQLDASAREGLDAERALDLMFNNPTLIKRPIVEYNGALIVGFKEDDYRNCIAM